MRNTLSLNTLLTYPSRHVFPAKAHADSDVKAVEVLWTFMTLRHGDVYGGRQKDGHVHCDYRFRPVHAGKQEREDVCIYEDVYRC